jgi:pimeloyl-ACP methyl ester carboxylesterase
VELWRFPDDSPLHRIPGFARAAAAEGARALGQDGRGAAAIAHEWRLLCSASLPALESVSVPAYLYWGTDDEVVPVAHAEAWLEVLGGAVTVRLYNGEAHDVQYRHWDQILLDVAGLGARTLVCHEGEAQLVATEEVEQLLCAGGTLGLCAWGAATMLGTRGVADRPP